MWSKYLLVFKSLFPRLESYSRLPHLLLINARWLRNLRPIRRLDLGMTPRRHGRHHLRLSVRLAFRVVFWRRLHHHRRAELALGAQFLAVDVEEDRDRDEDGGDAAKQGSGPLDAEVVEHLAGEEGKAGGGDRSEEGVSCDSGCGAV